MKKLLSAISLLLLFAFAANAQTERGKFVVSGSSALNFTNNLESGDNSVSAFSFKPTVGYFVINDLAITLGAAVDYQKEGTYDPDVSFAVGPGLTYYFPMDSKVRPFVGASLAFSTLKQTNTYDGNRYTYNGFAYGGGAGVAFFLRENVSLDLSLQYVGTEYSMPNSGADKLKAKALAAGVGFSIFF